MKISKWRFRNIQAHSQLIFSIISNLVYGNQPEQIIIHAGTNDISNNTNYLKNAKKNVKLVKETCKDTKLSFSSVICRTDIKDITDPINTTNLHLENYCKQQNVGLIYNGNIKKSDLNSKGLHLHERGSTKLTKYVLVFPMDLK